MTRDHENPKSQVPNKFQHAAQAPALRVTQFQKPKQRVRLPLRPTRIIHDPGYNLTASAILTNVLAIEYCDLRFICNLVLEI